ncbi:hypothetical protein FJTKL_03548 [Diaporthe vaccinii]|uniref:Alcohol dehydrogenase-like C-terminal domain-containing protein n=1 Tax=Diaporthe vaccinii TaxID=105482 RepID=A0ABR4DVV0_9PEZI
MAQPLPDTMRALVCDGPGQPLVVKTVPTPQPTMGSVVARVLCVQSQRSLQATLSGKTPFTFPQPMTPGNTGIGRVAAVGHWQLVMLDTFIRARDEPGVQILWGFWDGPSPASKKLAAENWSMGSLALQVGETVIVAPATGGFSGAAVNVARAMGATVLAMGRNTAGMERMAGRSPQGAVRPVPNTGDTQADAAALRAAAAGAIDAYLDFSPPQAAASTHLRSCFLALGQCGRAVMMGLVSSDLPVSYLHFGMQNQTVRGQFMYERANVRGLIQLVEKSLLRLGAEGGYELRGKYKLEEIDECFRATAAGSEAGQFVLITP